MSANIAATSAIGVVASDANPDGLVLEAKDLELRYGRALAVDKATLQIRHGEVLALVGANGAGKTSIMKAIAGSLAPTKGTVTFLGTRMQGSPQRAVRAGIAHCPEGRQVFPQMTVRENLDLGAYTIRDRVVIAERRDEMLELFPRLRERQWQAAGTMSGGEQQMLAMARALMSGPKLLLLDEPSMGLAPAIVEDVGDIIETLRQAGVAVLLVEESAELTTRVAKRVMVMEAGRIVMEGDVDEVLGSEVMRRLYLGESATT